MKTITIMLLAASVALNVCFFAGCKPLHDAVYGNPCKYATPVPRADDDGKSELVRIASLLNIKTDGKSAFDLSSDIRYNLDRNVDVPASFDSAAFERMATDLRVEEKKAMSEYQQFISDLQGKRVIVIEPEQCACIVMHPFACSH